MTEIVAIENFEYSIFNCVLLSLDGKDLIIYKNDFRQTFNWGFRQSK
jgi:hypothetical protein